MDDLGKQFEAFYKKTKVTINKFPVLAAQEATNFFQDSFNKQAFIGNTTENWKKRSEKTKRNKGRSILVDTGRLKRSIKPKKATWNEIIVGTDVEYASIHNNGFRGTVNVKAHRRKIASRNTTGILKGKSHKNSTAIKYVKTSSGVAFVKQHKMKMNMPQRKFIGNSPFLNKRIERQFILQLSTI